MKGRNPKYHPHLPSLFLPQKWVVGLSGHPGGLALSPAPKEPRPVNEYVITLLLSVGATAQERPSNHRPVTLRSSAPVSKGSRRGAQDGSVGLEQKTAKEKRLEHA